MDAQSLFKEIRRLEIVSRRLVSSALAGDYLSSFHGQGLEFDEVREYFPGDDVRRIDWNVTARMGRPFLKVFREERELSVIFAVDVSGSTAFGTQGSSKRELAAKLAASLGLAASRGGDRVGWVFFSDKVELTLPPRRGRRALLRGLRELLAMEPQGQGTDLGVGLRALHGMTRRKATVFLMSDFLAPLTQSTLRLASARHDVVALRLEDAAEAQLPAWVGLLAARDPESGRRYFVDTDSPWARRAFAKRRATSRASMELAFKRSAVDQVATVCGQDFTPALMALFRARERRRAR